MLLGRIAEHPHRSTGDGVQGFVAPADAVVYGTRKFAVKQEKVYDAVRRDMAMTLAVHYEGARRPENRRPLDIVQGRTYVRRRGKQHEIFDIQQPRRLIGALQ